MNHEDQFKYQSIDLATDAIRLLRLLRGSHQDPIQCELFESFLHQVDGVPYEALSYTWGTSHDVRKITLNDRKALIKESLHTALLALRQPDHDRLLWIDAICIDQNDFKEKGHQVGQMRQIYENAEQVVVWLGPSNRDTDAFMDMARRWDHETRQQPGARNAQRWVDSWIRLTADEIGPVGIEIAARRRDALQEILNRPWFRRVWILQEVASAKKATIQCGSKSMSSQGFGLLPFLLGLRVDSHTQAVLDILPSYRRRDTWWGEKQDLQTLLVKFRTSKATDDRDRIYALLGISSDACTSSTLLPNYGKSIGDVVRNTIQFLLFKNARCLFAHRLPYDLTLNTFLYLVPNLPDFIYAWSLRSGNDDIAAAVLPQVVNLNIPEHLTSGISTVVLQDAINVNTPRDIVDNTIILVRSSLSWMLQRDIGFRFGLQSMMYRSVKEHPKVERKSPEGVLLNWFEVLVHNLCGHYSILNTKYSEKLLYYAAQTGARHIFWRAVFIVASLANYDWEYEMGVVIYDNLNRGQVTRSIGGTIPVWLAPYFMPQEGAIETDNLSSDVDRFFDVLFALGPDAEPANYIVLVLASWRSKVQGTPLSFNFVTPEDSED